MKKVINMRYLLGGYRFARGINDFEMLEQHWFAIMEEIKDKPRLYKRFILWRMRKDFREMTTFRVMRFLTSKKPLGR